MGKKSVDSSLLETVFENINTPSEGRDVNPVARVEDVEALITKILRGTQQTRKRTQDMLVYFYYYSIVHFLYYILAIFIYLFF